MSKTYEFSDIFKKTCSYENGEGKCVKTRESRKCINNKCEKVLIPEKKSQVLDDYYKQIQYGGDRKKSKIDKYGKVVRGKRVSIKETEVMNMLLYNLKMKHRCHICDRYKFQDMKEHLEKHEQFRCPICKKYLTRFTIQDHVNNHEKQLKIEVPSKQFTLVGGSRNEPKDTNLYNSVKRAASKKFKSPSGIYRSSWIVKEYLRRGGKYSNNKKETDGLTRWFKEKWVDISRPIKNSKGKVIGYKSCGRKTQSGKKYPLCRPSKKINKKTPKTYKELSSKSINKAKRDKSRVKSTGNIKFGGSEKKHECPVCKEVVFKQSKLQISKGKCGCGVTSFAPTSSTGQIQCGGCGENCIIEGGGKTRSQYKGTRSKIMIKVPENVKKTALYSYKLKSLGFKGGLETGWKRAKQLSTKSEIPIEDLRFIKAWFARHIYASYPSYKKWIDSGRSKTSEWHRKNGIVSWLIWAGDAGFNWVNSQKNVNLLNKHYPNKNYVKTRLPKS